MKSLFYIFVSFFSFFSFSQVIDSKNFNSSEMNRVLLKKFNSYRLSKGLDTLVYSQVSFDSLSFKNCVEVANSGKFYHPSITERWKKQPIRESIVNESKNKVGGDVIRHSTGLPWLETWENAFRVNGYFKTYEEIADLAIKSWENSPSHNRVQNLDFESGGLPGFFSCHSVYTKEGYLYIYINFVKVHRL
jgi:hypothetical protein